MHSHAPQSTSSPPSTLISRSALFAQITLRGIGQIFLQNHAPAGLLILLGMLWASPAMGVGTLLGALTGTVVAMALKYPRAEIIDGLYGFNGALVGVAACFFFGVSPASSILLLGGAALATVLMRAMMQRVPAYTAPFILTTWGLILLVKYTGVTTFADNPLPAAAGNDLVAALSMGISQVMFQANIITGLLFLAALLLSSRIAAAYALWGCVLATGIALALQFPTDSINGGIWGYNAVLCAVALGDTTRRGLLLATGAALLSVALTLGFARIGFIALTAPFVLATWAALAAAHRQKSRAPTPAPGT